jgi:hypothetical protein
MVTALSKHDWNLLVDPHLLEISMNADSFHTWSVNSWGWLCITQPWMEEPRCFVDNENLDTKKKFGDVVVIVE